MRLIALAGTPDSRLDHEPLEHRPLAVSDYFISPASALLLDTRVLA